MNSVNSTELFDKAKRVIPGGVNSPVRAFRSVNVKPPFIQWAKGSKIADVDGNEYIDYVGSWGPMILGHTHPAVVEAIQKKAESGSSYGAPTELEIDVAQLIIDAFPSVEMVRMVNSGTEATMSAIRLARGYTGREKIVKFEGCYHGHSDSLLIKAGSGALTHGVPDSPGVTEGAARDTINCRYNDTRMLEEIFSVDGDKIAAVIVELVAGNMGVVLPKPEFIKSLRETTKKYGALLIIDEVMTGFRVAYGGAQTLYGLDADITCLGKIIGGGLPVGAYGGRKEIMEKISPTGPIYQAGTLSGNPLAMAAGYTTLKMLRDNPEIYKTLENKAAALEKGFKENAQKLGVKASFNRVGSMLCIFFTEKEVVDYDTAVTSDTGLFAAYFEEMLKRGIYLAPSQFEAAFVSAAHSDEDIEKTVKAGYEALETVIKGR